MLKLFQSIFGGGEVQGRYPESLVEAAIERTVDGTDPRLRSLPRYRKQLRPAVLQAVDHVVALVDSFPAAQLADRDGYGHDLRLAALFASAERMFQIFGADPVLREFHADQPGAGGPLFALLLAERVEKKVMGIEMENETLRRDVAQVAVNFRGHRLVDPATTEEEARKQLKRRAFDHLLSLALQRIAEVSKERADLGQQRALLRRKLDTLHNGGWGFDETDKRVDQPAEMQAELEETERQLTALGADDRTLQAHLDITADSLAGAAQQLWAEDLDLHLDQMNIQRDPADRTSRHIRLQELHNARGRRLVTLPVSITPGDLPQQDDFFAAAQRLLG
ncbi:MAG: hypothetical protein WBM58_10155 [Sedimenticolaceae bacterium]